MIKKIEARSVSAYLDFDSEPKDLTADTRRWWRLMGLSGAKNICRFEFPIQPDWIQQTAEGKEIKKRHAEDRALPLLLHFRPVKITRPVLRGTVSFLYLPLSLARSFHRFP